MSDFDSNPFADPEANNPFADPSVQQAAQPSRPPGLDDYNPFADQQRNTQTQPQFQVPPPQPAVMQATEQPPPYTPSPAQAAINTDELQRRQEELERKEAELARKEQEMRSMQSGVRANNFPPLPASCCVQPCFYQDFNVDIPNEFRRTVKIIYYLWLFYVCVLFLNVLAALAYFIASSQGSYGNNAGVTFGLSILYLVLFTPCSFICWYRPLYKAFRSDSSFNFFVFFFIFFFQFCVTVLQCIGIDGWGTCGIIAGLSMVTKASAGAKAIGVMLIMMGFIFGLNAAADMIILIKVHRIYRSTGASFEKAQAEFASGVMSNKNVQTAAASAGQHAVRGAFQGQTDNRY